MDDPRQDDGSGFFGALRKRKKQQPRTQKRPKVVRAQPTKLVECIDLEGDHGDSESVLVDSEDSAGEVENSKTTTLWHLLIMHC